MPVLGRRAHQAADLARAEHPQAVLEDQGEAVRRLLASALPVVGTAVETGRTRTCAS